MDSDVSVQSAVADEVNRRLQKATRELEAKYRDGSSSSMEENGPTGAAYKEKYLQEQKLRKVKKESQTSTNNEQTVDPLNEEGNHPNLAHMIPFRNIFPRRE
jgi:hypothetical protein